MISREELLEWRRKAEVVIEANKEPIFKGKLAPLGTLTEMARVGMPFINANAPEKIIALIDEVLRLRGEKCL